MKIIEKELSTKTATNAGGTLESRFWISESQSTTSWCTHRMLAGRLRSSCFMTPLVVSPRIRSGSWRDCVSSATFMQEHGRWRQEYAGTAYQGRESLLNIRAVLLIATRTCRSCCQESLVACSTDCIRLNFERKQL